MTRAITALIQSQLVQERPDLIFSTGPGRPRVPVELAPAPRLHVGISIFAREYFVGFFDTKGRTVRSRQVPFTLARNTPERFWEHVSTTVRVTGGCLNLPIANIGIASIGCVDEFGTVTLPFAGWDHANCTSRLLAEFGAPVSVSSIASALAAAELFAVPTGPVPPTLILVADDTLSAAAIMGDIVASIPTETTPTSVDELIDAVTPLVHDTAIQRIILAGATFIRDEKLRFSTSQRLCAGRSGTVELRLVPERQLEMRSAARAIALDKCIAHPVTS